jgi:gliding motility-associated-like protein
MKRYVCLLTLILIIPILTLKAQLCKGTLGAPIFIETFGSGTGPGPALPAGSTTYSYVSGWPVDGNYTIANTSNPAPQNPHWYTGKDHTGDPNGYMFVVNASYAPGEFFRYTVSGLCSNTTYVFSAWIANVNDTNTVKFCKENDPPYVYPSVLFKVQNSITKKTDSLSTGNIAPSGGNIVWHEFGFTFSTGSGQSTVILTMVNNGKGGCGNDLVIDDISFRPCGPSTSIAAVPAKKIYCSGDALLLDAVIGAGYSNPVYQWQFSSNGGTTWQDVPGATGQDLSLNPLTTAQTGKYRLILAESGNINLSKCRIITESITINIAQSPKITAAANPTVICNGSTSLLSASGTTAYVWSNQSMGASVPVSPAATTTYTVTGTDTLTGCIDKATATITVNAVPNIPTVVAPDSICAGNQATLKATAPGGTYKWYTTATGGTPIHTGDTYQTPVLNTTTTYYVEVESAASCTSKSRTAVTVNVNLIPVSPVIAGGGTICSGSSVTLTATAPGGTYKWYDTPTGGTPFFTGNNYFIPALTSTKTFYVEVESTSKCTSTARTPVTIIVNTVPHSAVVTGPDSICSGNSATLTATAPGGTYKWYETATGGSVIFTGDVFQTPVLNTTKTYYVEVESAVSCISVLRTAVTVFVNRVPTAPVIVAPDTICENNIATLTATAPGGTYRWYDVASGGTPLFKGLIYKPVLKDTKTYYVEVESASKCTSITRTPVTVTVSKVRAEFTANPATGMAPLKVDFTNSSTGANSYHWDLGDQTETTTQHVTHTYSTEGQGAVYNVVLTVTNSFGCKDTTEIRIVVNPFSELIIPNVFTPNNDGINDVFTLKSIGLNFVNALVYDRWGLKMYEWSVLNGGWDGKTSGTDVPEGTYFYIIVAKGVDGKDYKLTGPFTLLR